jgi:pyruvate formate lyase activating enzyme
MIGLVHSIQSLGAVDGPGIRYTVFLSGCNLRCGCCHNPDTWTSSGATEYESEAIVENALRYREYFGKNGGITLSGGEPLLQARFCTEVFEKAHENGINTCLDTSGSIINSDVCDLLSVCDRVLLDIKYTSNRDYLRFVGTSLDAVISFLSLLEEKNVKTTVRQVVIPTLNDDCDSLLRLKNLTRGYSCIDSFEFLPFKKICRTKYENMGISFPFDDYCEPSESQMEEIRNYFHSL